jgi:hypothetical protein
VEEEVGGQHIVIVALIRYKSSSIVYKLYFLNRPFLEGTKVSDSENMLSIQRITIDCCFVGFAQFLPATTSQTKTPFALSGKTDSAPESEKK